MSAVPGAIVSQGTAVVIAGPIIIDPVARIRERGYIAELSITAIPDLPPANLSGVGERLHAANALLVGSPIVIEPTIAIVFNQLLELPDAAGNPLASFHDAGRRLVSSNRMDAAQKLPRNRLAHVMQAAGKPLAVCSRFRAAEQLRYRQRKTARHAHALRRSAHSRSLHAETRRLRRRASAAYAHGLRRTHSSGAGWAEQRRTRNSLTARQAQSIPHAVGLASRSRPALSIPAGHHLLWAHMLRPAPGRWWPFYEPPFLSGPVVLQCPYEPRPLECQVVLHWHPIEQPYCPGVDPEPPEQGLVIPIRRVYIVLPTVQITRLDTGVEIPCGGLTLSTDADGHTWSGRLTLLGKGAKSALAGSGPVVLVAAINGHEWRLIVDQWSETVSFGRRAIAAQCRGLPALLSAPWQPLSSGVNQAGTIQQVLQALLPSPWTLEWEATESPWSVPAGAWSWADQSPIGAIHAAAQGVGLVLVPSLDSELITARSRYPVPPWQYGAASPDITVPQAAITNYQRQEPQPGANAVIVHGGDTGGELINASLTGTAGDILAPTKSSPLINDIAAGRSLSTRLLSAENPGSEWRSITIPLGGDFPLAQFGQLIEISAGPDTARDTVTGLQITVTAGDRPSVRQTLGLGETNNPATRFRALIPGEPTRIGTVAETHGTTATITLLTGQTIRARGEAIIGQQVYVQDGQITGPAPTLPSHQITI